MKPSVNEMVSINGATLEISAEAQPKLSTLCDNAATSPSEPRTAPLTPEVGPVSVQEQQRLVRRRELIGQIVKLSKEQQDALSPSNEYAMAPGFPWLAYIEETRTGHTDLRYFHYAKVVEVNGELVVLKTYTEAGLNRIAEAVEHLAPLMAHFHLSVPVFYEVNRLRQWGYCDAPIVYDGHILAETIALNSRDTTYIETLFCLAHELAHIGYLHHRRSFRLHFGELLDWHICEGPCSWREAEILRHINTRYDRSRRSALLSENLKRVG